MFVNTFNRSVSRIKQAENLFIEVKNLKSDSLTNVSLNDSQHFEIVWIVNGTGRRHIEAESVDIIANRVFFIYPGSGSSWSDLESIEGKRIIFSEEFLLYMWKDSSPISIPFFSFINNVPYVDIATKQQNHLTHLLELIEDEYNAINEHNNYDIISSYLKIFLTKILSSAGMNTLTSHPLIEEFELLLEKHFRTHQHVEDYAKMVHLSPNYLNDLVRSKTGKSVGWWIRKRRLTEAKRRLLFTEDSISTISHQLHFNDISYFCRFFKKYTGKSPLQFRRNHQHSKTS